MKVVRDGQRPARPPPAERRTVRVPAAILREIAAPVLACFEAEQPQHAGARAAADSPPPQAAAGAAAHAVSEAQAWRSQPRTEVLPRAYERLREPPREPLLRRAVHADVSSLAAAASAPRAPVVLPDEPDGARGAAQLRAEPRDEIERRLFELILARDTPPPLPPSSASRAAGANLGGASLDKPSQPERSSGADLLAAIAAHAQRAAAAADAGRDADDGESTSLALSEAAAVRAYLALTFGRGAGGGGCAGSRFAARAGEGGKLAGGRHEPSAFGAFALGVSVERARDAAAAPHANGGACHANGGACHAADARGGGAARSSAAALAPAGEEGAGGGGLYDARASRRTSLLLSLIHI